jgi:hypothetical protein
VHALPYHCLIDLVDFSFGIKARTEFDAVNAIATLNIISPTDTSVFAPLIHSFQMPPTDQRDLQTRVTKDKTYGASP